MSTGVQATALDQLAGHDFATVNEVAQILRMDRTTVARRIAAGDIPAIGDGKSTRVPMRWLREQARA